MGGCNCALLGPSAMANGCWQQSHQISPERGRQSLTPAKSQMKQACNGTQASWMGLVALCTTKLSHNVLLLSQRESVVLFAVDGMVSVLSKRDNKNKIESEMTEKLSWKDKNHPDLVHSIPL